MTVDTDTPGRPSAERAEHGLRRMRVFYATGTALWAASAAWTAWTHPGSRQMWVALLLLIVFGGLLGVTSRFLAAVAPGRRSSKTPYGRLVGATVRRAAMGAMSSR
ncbi:hypothetical protein [Streptomyces sp. NPDC046939]|uniref:hypothetical protein n=1 Tax=Streptomyces sp. NPDC046939 TaxID=3155376 RepID=UPI00340F4470